MTTIGVAIQASMIAIAGSFLLGWEGSICIVMAAPILLVITILGALLGHHVLADSAHVRERSTKSISGLIIVVPLFVLAEPTARGEAELRTITTAVVIDAPREVVWQHVIRFEPLPPPEDWLFRTGIAYPIRAEIDGEGVGAVRHCIFTTGAFVEPITAWDAPYRLAFSVAAQPHPMQEWTLYEEVHPPHLDGYFRTERGQFLLTSLPGGRTRLEGTTWYRHDLWPQAYWQPWSTFVLHRIHRRVLKHIQHLSEAAAL
jgi:hypothetical protein